MSLRLSGNFYKKTLSRFEQFADEPLVFPILLGFLKKAAQSKVLLQGAKAVIGDDDAFRAFFNKTRTSLAPTQAQLLQEQEAKIREKLKTEVEAEVRREVHQHPLAIELKLRKEYEEHALHAQERNQEIIKTALDNIVSTNAEKEKVVKATIDNLIDAITQRADLNNIVQLQLESKAELKAMREKYEVDAEANKKRHDNFVEKAEQQAKRDKIHKYIGYAVGAVGVAVSVVSWPSVWNRIVGQSEPPAPLQVRLASSGQCLPSDTRIEIKKDGTTTLPSSGSVCLIVPENSPSTEGDGSKASSPVHVLPENGWSDPLSGKNALDLLNDGQTVKLFKKDGSSICLHMPKPVPCIGAGVPPATIPQKQKESAPDRHWIAPYIRRHFPNRCP